MLELEIYRQYVVNTIKLVRSFIIKSNQTITTINNFLTNNGDTLSNNEHEWKYYKNIGGFYYNTSSSGLLNDEYIYIYSLDINQNIVYSSSNLLNHELTLADLKTKGTTYRNLINKYPSLQLLIEGVINPIDSNTAIAATDYTILYYDKQYLNDNETQLITDIQTWLYNYTSRWDNANFSLSDNLYSSANLGIIYLLLVIEIINIRLNYAKTNLAHDFHVDNYLASFFNIKENMAGLNKTQKLFLYRNLYSFIFLGGNTDNINFLNTEFIKPTGINLLKYDIYQDNKVKFDTIINDPTVTGLIPDISINEYPYENPYFEENDVVKLEPYELINRINSQTLYNKKDNQQDLIRLENLSQHNPIFRVPTKILSTTKTFNFLGFFIDILYEKITNWLYLTANDYIKYDIALYTNDKNNTIINLSAKQAVVVFLYCINKSLNLEVINIPILLIKDIMTIPLLTKDQQLAVIEPKYVTGSLRLKNKKLLKWDRYKQLLNARTLPKTINTIIEFNEHIEKVIINKFQHKILPTLEPNPLGKTELYYLINSFYNNTLCNYSEFTTYNDFFTSIKYDFSTLSNANLLSLSKNIIETYVDINSGFKENITINNIIEIVKTISSYTLLFIKGNDTERKIPIDWPFIYFDNFNRLLSSTKYTITVVPPDYKNVNWGCYKYVFWNNHYYPTCQNYNNDDYILYNTPTYPYIDSDSFNTAIQDPLKIIFAISNKESYSLTEDMSFSRVPVKTLSGLYDDNKVFITSATFSLRKLILSSNLAGEYTSSVIIDSNYPPQFTNEYLALGVTLTGILKDVIIVTNVNDSYTTTMNISNFKFNPRIPEKFNTAISNINFRFIYAVRYTNPNEKYITNILNNNFSLHLPDAKDNSIPSISNLTFTLF